MRRALRCTVVAVAVAAGCIGAGPAWAPIASSPDRTWVTDGTVDAVARLGDTVYIGGSFTSVGPRTGSGAAIDTATGQPDLAMPELGGGRVYAVAGDGAGGWFVGGSFSIGGYELVHIRADKTVDSSFRATPNGAVRAIAVSGGTMYLGGSFTSISGQLRPHIAALDATTGAPTAWNPNADAEVDVLAEAAFIPEGCFDAPPGSLMNDLYYMPERTVNADLFRLAAESGKAFELGFFARLREEVRKELNNAPQLIRFSGLRSCVKQLAGAHRWCPRCEKLSDHIVEYLRGCVSSENPEKPCGMLVV